MRIINLKNIKTGDDGNLNITSRMMNMTSKSVFI
jgi:hypothetical protein